MEATLPSHLDRSPAAVQVVGEAVRPRWEVQNFHAILATAFCATAGGAWLGAIRLGVRSDGLLPTILAIVLVFLVLLPVTTYLYSRGQKERGASLLILHWEILSAALLPYAALVAARLRWPLQDRMFLQLDALAGVHVPALVVWTRAHPWIAFTTDQAYRCLQPLLLLAALLPAATGRLRAARQFLLANLCAVALSLPMFALWPAIGPWTARLSTVNGAGFAATVQQQSCAALIAALRQPPAFLYRFGSALPIISFPSFHVIWAVLSAHALWSFRFARWPVAVLTGLIVLSTMTSGWHYGVDVLAGLGIATASLAVARQLSP